VIEAPTSLGRFEIVRHLAMGGMAEVLLGRGADLSGNLQYVVIKRIRPEQRTDPQFVQMFLDEAKIASLLEHPNVVRVVDIADRNDCFFAMEYVHGEDLRRVLGEVYRRRDQLPIALITNLVAGAAAGLHHAHERTAPDGTPLGIVHRDVSPANILVGYDGVVKVTDFGIAKAALRTVETRSGTLKGKVSYMSPEQVTGKPVDRRSDVFALGIVLYEVATARRLFKGDNDYLTMNAIVQGLIPRPSDLRPDLPRILEDIIMTALAGSPKDRFQSCEEMRAELESFTSRLGMKLSPNTVADYMHKLFGHRAEPWMVDDEPTITIFPVDFDGAEAGIASLPTTPVQGPAFPAAWRPTASSPIRYALEDTGLTPTGMAWASEPTPITPRRRSRLLAISLGAALTAGAGTVVVMKASDGGPAVQTVEMTASPPPTAPAPAPDPEPPAADPDPSPPDPVPAVAAPAPVHRAAPVVHAEAKPVAATPTPRAEVKPPEIKPPPVHAEVKPPPVKVEPPPVKVEPPAHAAAKAPPPKKRTIARRPKPKTDKTTDRGSAWDPNALFAPK